MEEAANQLLNNGRSTAAHFCGNASRILPQKCASVARRLACR